MATIKSQRAGEAFKRLIETDDATREACERIGDRLELLIPLLNRIAADTRSELQKHQLGDIDPFSHDGLLTLAKLAKIREPETMKARDIIETAIKWAYDELCEIEREKYCRKIRGKVPKTKRKRGAGRPTDKTIPQRDKDIYAQSKRGVCHGEIADQYDLGQKYVGQIVRQQRKKAEKSTR
jgi:hypothetical protein